MIFKKKDEKEIFWKWFLKNQTKLENFISSENRNYAIYNELTKQLKKFNDLLFPEITIDKENNFILIITPDGIRDGVNPTIEIVKSAPIIRGWKIKKFRQASDKISLNFKGLQFTYDDIKIWRYFILEQDKVDISVLIKNYDEKDNRYISLAFLYLDHILGEYNVLTRVGEINFLGWDKLNDKIESVELLTLRKEIEEKLY